MVGRLAGLAGMGGVTAALLRDPPVVAVVVCAVLLMVVVLVRFAKWVLKDDDRARRAKELMEPFFGNGTAPAPAELVTPPKAIQERWWRASTR